MFTDKQYFQAWAVVSVFLFATFYRWPGRRLDHIPAAGSKSQLFSFIGAFKFFLNARDIVQQGSEQFRDSIFRIPNLDRWVVVITGPKLIEELRKAPEDVLSFHEATDEALQIQYTLGANVSHTPYHIPIVRSQLTRSLAALFPALLDEVRAAFDNVITVRGEEWSKFSGLETMMPIICRASNRIFVGAPLCRDPEYININIQFTLHVMKTAGALLMLPSFLRPLVGPLLKFVPASIDRSVELLRPLVEERKRKIEEYGKDYPDKPLDFLSWLMDEAEGDETSLRNLTLRVLTINFAAIHTSSMTFTHALFYLAAHPKYAQIMRDEIQEVVSQEGWTHSALGRMTKVDSFIKESQRLNPLACLMMGRVARQPFTFSDGTYIPKGTTLQVAAHSAHIDDENYTNPTAFEPFRFVDKNVGRKVDMVSTHTDFIAFGHGRHACPGRFFAANELKLMLAHLVMNYDVKLENEGVRPENMWFMSSCLPNMKAEVMFRKRAV